VRSTRSHGDVWFCGYLLAIRGQHDVVTSEPVALCLIGAQRGDVTRVQFGNKEWMW